MNQTISQSKVYYHSKMTYSAVSAIINLVLAIRPDFQELVLLNKLNNYFHFDHNLFLLESSIHTNRFIDRKQLNYIPKSVYFLKVRTVI